MGRGSNKSRTQFYREQRYRESRAAFGKTRQTFFEYVENCRGRLCNEAGNYVRYSDKGEIEVNKREVEQAASIYVEVANQLAQYPKSYVVETYYEAPGGRRLSTKYAESKLNQEQAIKARAILLAAKFGKAKLTRAQKEKLQEAENGRYLKLVYSKYTAGERGTLAGKPRKIKGAGTTNAATPEAREEKRRAFYEEIYQHSGRRPRKRV